MRTTIKTVSCRNGRVEYLLINAETGEPLLRGDWQNVMEMKRQLDSAKVAA